MQAVGIRELKARLSHYLREVRRGDVVLVTDRGRVVAELRRPGDPYGTPSGMEGGLARLAAEGGLVVREAHDPDAYGPSGVSASDGTAAALLDEERADG